MFSASGLHHAVGHVDLRVRRRLGHHQSLGSKTKRFFRDLRDYLVVRMADIGHVTGKRRASGTVYCDSNLLVSTVHARSRIRMADHPLPLIPSHFTFPYPVNMNMYQIDFLESMANGVPTDQDYASISNSDESELSICNEAKARWLNAEEIIELLSGGNQQLELATSPPSSPPQSGTLILYDRLAIRNYKADGHEWIRKKSNPRKIREDHVKLRYRGCDRIRGNYVHSSEIKTFHRRAYSLIDTDREVNSYGERNHECEKARQDFVLVHYLDTEEAAKMAPKKAPAMNATSGRGRKRTMSMSGMSTSSTNGDQLAHATHAYTSSFVAAREGICTAKSHDEVLAHVKAAHGCTDREGDDTAPSGSDYSRSTSRTMD